MAAVTGNSSDATVAGVMGSNSNNGDGVVGIAGTVLGFDRSKSCGVLGEHGGSGVGVRGMSLEGNGIEGVAGADGEGVFATSAGGNGVHGRTGNATTSGVYGENTGAGPGVAGSGASGEGVFGTSGMGNGVHGRTGNGTTSGVYGENTGAGPGVSGSSVSGIGVQGISSTGNGLFGRSVSGDAVLGTSTTGNGVHGISVNNVNSGVWGENTLDGPGVSGSSLHGWGVFGSSQDGLAGRFQGDVHVTGTMTAFTDIVLGTGAGDCAEEFYVSGQSSVEPGTVMVIAGNDELEPSSRAYDRSVAGVISGAGDLRPGIVLDRQQSDRNRASLALVGKVYCKVDADHAAIEVGDLLATSPTIGHAMKVDDPARAFGAVIGKALRPLRSGKGLLPILVALQ
jgi:hypothetical protein